MLIGMKALADNAADCVKSLKQAKYSLDQTTGPKGKTKT